MLEVSDLHVSYGRAQAVRGFSASVSAGRITLVLGTNGAGKTTSLRAISGLQRATSGSVLLDGTEVLGRPAHRIVAEGLSLVPEGRRIFSRLTIDENLRMGAYSAPKSYLAADLDRVYEMFPILRERRSGAGGLLSGGEQQMLAFGRALMARPRVMLLDEPSMGLAPAIVDQVIASVRAIADSGIAVLMVEQNADVGMRVADDVVVVVRGEVAFSGPADDARSRASLVRAFLGETPLDVDAPPGVEEP
ncbi:ABC transporter ATP-binding protein [Microbacterium sp. zg.B48]|uniref:ABC transporter ATP-binding protein n=1 Tax=Microbacterium sp. zg.B48 TaxID=2969408 RepID=UPI00214CBD11|nr:ABC transporter ATP-binding protein [Microbacterium sp. zg.B48]MCR2764359.1 ABC transporter ATP-binding protein [Microbacterium sp. zg.B48]